MAKETLKKPGSKKSASKKSTSVKTAHGVTKKKGSSRKKAAKKKKRAIIFGVEIVLLLLLVGGFYVVRLFDKFQKPQVEEEDMQVNETITPETVETMSGYMNVALFGLDTRNAGQLGKGNRSDTIIIASINNDTKEVKLVSVYRDTYLDLTNGKYNKCNEAYSVGGPGQAVRMLNKNLDLDIEYYIAVDFAALAEAVDLLGGIYIDVDESEIGHLNNYTVETSKVTGKSTTKLTQPGYQLLDGVQATSYCRIRYTAGDDFKRTERQREVVMELVSTAKKASLDEINSIVNAIFGMIATNYELDELVEMTPEMIGYDIVDTQGFPFDRTPATVSGKGSCVIPINLADNVKQLHEYLFDDYSYTASSEVQEISDKITSDTGY
ncbi:MAG TPA: transcriptional regulator [Lachnospiraceae bacterium]|nr:transcriptional regulator [Lachnospiraceae bacterium]